MNESPLVPIGPSALQQAGIEQRDIAIGQVRLREVTELALARLRMGDAMPTDRARNLQLPARTGQCSGNDPVFLCLGPREWLVISATAAPQELVQSLQSSVGDDLAAVYDQTPGFVVLRVTGDAAPWLLSKLSSLDFVSGTASGQHCARTRMADAAVTIHYHQGANDQSAFDLIADRSIAAYLWRLLRDCAPHANELSNTFGVAR